MNYKYFKDKALAVIYYVDKADARRLEFDRESGSDLFGFWCREIDKFFVLDVATIGEFCFEDKRGALLKALEYVDARSDAIRAELTCDAFRESVPSVNEAAGRLFKYVKEGM